MTMEFALNVLSGLAVLLLGTALVGLFAMWRQITVLSQSLADHEKHCDYKHEAHTERLRAVESTCRAVLQRRKDDDDE